MADDEYPEELRRRHDIFDIEGGGYISINRPRNAPPLTKEEELAFRQLAEAALRHAEEVASDG